LEPTQKPSLALPEKADLNKPAIEEVPPDQQSRDAARRLQPLAIGIAILPQIEQIPIARDREVGLPGNAQVQAPDAGLRDPIRRCRPARPARAEALPDCQLPEARVA
jgi:hypothetical protein